MYNYQEMKHEVFKEENQEQFLKIRDNISELLKTAGACTVERAIKGATGDSWTHLAMIDRLIELGELQRIAYGASQHAILIKG